MSASHDERGYFWCDDACCGELVEIAGIDPNGLGVRVRWVNRDSGNDRAYDCVVFRSKLRPAYGTRR